MRTWQRNLAIVDAQLRAEYYSLLIEVAKITPALARIHTEKATIEEMKVYLSHDKSVEPGFTSRITFYPNASTAL
jgi:hypothetical protein